MESEILVTTKFTAEMIELGRCLGPYGLKGGVKVCSYSRPPEKIFSYKRLFLKFRDRKDWYFSRGGFFSANQLVILFSGVETRTASELLRGAKIFVERASFPPSGEDHYYWADLIGFTVYNLGEVKLGTVSGFLETGDHDVMRVLANRERLIPFVFGVYVLDVSLEKREILVDWHSDD